jgi:hypothetical protein
MRRKGSVKEGYEGRRLTEEGLFFWRVLLDFLVRGLEFCSGEDHYGGHRFAGGFGHGGQDSLTVSWG